MPAVPAFLGAAGPKEGIKNRKKNGTFSSQRTKERRSGGGTRIFPSARFWAISKNSDGET